MIKVWLVMTILGRVAGGIETPSDMVYCEQLQVIEEPRAKRLIHQLGEWNGTLVTEEDVKVSCLSLHGPPRVGKPAPKHEDI